MNNRTLIASLAACSVALSALGQPQLVTLYQSSSDNGIFTPLNASNAPFLTYGDSGWIGFGSTPPFAIESITLELATANATANGTADVTVTFNDGDPSGLIFGPGTELRRVVFPSLEIIGAPDATLSFPLTVNLGGVRTAGGFNNIGFSLAVSNVQFDGSIGFVCSTASGHIAGFYTNNASFRDTRNGPGWGLFSFGPDTDTQIANFTARIDGYATPVCRADYGAQGGQFGQDGTLDNNDFIAFIDLFFSQHVLADVGVQGGQAGQDQTFNNNDFIVFIDLFFNGC